MDNIIRMAIIGTGLAWKKLHLPALKRLQDKYKVVAMANPTRSKLESAADEINLSHDNLYEDYREMLKRDDIDVVNVLVPIELNYIVSKDVAKAGINIICEKPLASNEKEAKKFLDLEKKYDVNIMIAENYRYCDENNIIKTLVDEKRIGDIFYFTKVNISDFKESLIKPDSYASRLWRQHPDFKGGTILDGGVHDIAAIRHIFGDIENISAYGIPSDYDFTPYSIISVNLQMKTGIVGNYVYCSTEKEVQKPAIGFRIFGSKGNIYLENKDCGIINVFYNDGGHEMIHYTPNEGFYNELLNYYNFINNKEDLSVTPEVEFKDTYTIFTILDYTKSRIK
jgi:predicted dehydrogenase